MSVSRALSREDIDELEAMMRETDKESQLMWQEGG